MQITGIVLAGGKSIRMGTDKAFFELKGQILLERAIEICKPYCSSILISSNNPDHQKGGCKIIPDEIKDCGPLGGIYSCLKQSETGWNFVLSVDAAFVESDFISFLISETDGFDVVVPIHVNGKEPLIALYHKNCLDAMSQMLDSGDYKMHNLLNTIKTNFVGSQHWVEKYQQIFCNLNRPEDANL